ncbi:type VI secretion system Vgr family protein [Thalassococcus sp. S3]|uniref:type VI secretion system Vgr family protein n=1 Tax=Thalassococcus sp. S3 TaxID=2017482 RepID=UPI00102402F5|nr:type VI secretion system tip protein TssI/VgrG [Thalassococcus sp. S3]QBF33648.1 type VI secretion protein VgrG [Thalassococcus sp. S3]
MNAAADFVQAERILRIDGLLGADELLAERMSVREGVSALFEIDLQVRSKQSDLLPTEIVGKTADVSLELGGGARRTWNALVTELVAGPKMARAFRSYRLVLRPSLWLFSQRSDCRIWKDMTSIEVCETLMSEHGLPNPVSKGVVPKPEKQHYSVQYNETDLAYLTRRLEEDGIFFWFEHEVGRHVLHLSSHISGYMAGEEVRFAHGTTDRNHINRFETRFTYTPGVRAARDWNFEKPGEPPQATTPSTIQLPRNGQYELYEFQTVGGYGTDRASQNITDSSVERQTRLHMQAVEADHRRVDGSSTVRSLCPGGKFTPYDLSKPDNAFDEHVVLFAEHHVNDASFETGGGQPEYHNHFVALPADLPATPHRASPRPRIDGTQVAIVAGPDGEEIHPDAYGRIKLWFPWDRKAVKDGSDTCWVRVMQNWAGSGWGGQVIPRIGMEVMVTYLDGDPDRPVVTGVVPNEKQKVPYNLPANKTKSVFRSNSHKSEGFNELTFEDATGQEKIYVHAQRDQEVHVEHDRSKRVDRNQLESVGMNKNIEVGNNHHEVIGGNMTLMVGPNRMQRFVTQKFTALTSALGDMASKLGLPDMLNMGEGNLIVGVAKNKAETIMLSATEVVGAGKAVTVGGGLQTVVGGIQNTTVGIGAYEEVGQNKATIVGKQYEIVVGDSKILIQEDGTISITGKKVLIDGKELVRITGKSVKIN